MLAALNDVFREVFDDSSLVISEATNASHIETWDSYNHISLITAIEERFGVTFTTKEIGAFTCVGDVVKLLTEKGVRAS